MSQYDYFFIRQYDYIPMFASGIPVYSPRQTVIMIK
eukprot:UN18796